MSDGRRRRPVPASGLMARPSLRPAGKSHFETLPACRDGSENSAASRSTKPAAVRREALIGNTDVYGPGFRVLRRLLRTGVCCGAAQVSQAQPASWILTERTTATAAGLRAVIKSTSPAGSGLLPKVRRRSSSERFKHGQQFGDGEQVVNLWSDWLQLTAIVIRRCIRAD